MSDFQKSLNQLCWLLGSNYQFKDDIYYIGGTKHILRSINHNGLSDSLIQAFNDQVFKVGDKLLIKGDEDDVNRIYDGIRSVISRDYVNVWLYVVEYSHNINSNVSLDFTAHIEGQGFSFDDFKNGQTHLEDFFLDKAASNFKLDYNNDYSDVESNVLINTSVGILSGEVTQFHVGSQDDREIYTRDKGGDVFVSGYESFDYGLELEMEGIQSVDGWIIRSKVVDSRQTAKLSRDSIQYKSLTKIKRGETRVLATLDSKQTIKSKSGFLYSIPFLNKLLPSGNQVKKKRVYFILSCD